MYSVVAFDIPKTQNAFIKNYFNIKIFPCIGWHVKPLVPAAFAVVSTYQYAKDSRGGLWPVLLMYNS
jgi:hypothetical protein